MNLSNRHLVIFCLVFTLVQLSFGIGGMGMEMKGSPILIAPFRIYFLNWALLLFAVFWTKHAKNLTGLRIFLFAMTLHYVLTAMFVIREINRYRAFPSDEEGLGRVLAHYPEEIVFAVVTYVLGNLFIWFLFFRRRSISSPSR